MSAPIRKSAVCLGCGCLCDDIGVQISDERIVSLTNTCSLGERWFGDGVLPSECLIDGAEATFDEAAGTAANLLVAEPGRLLIYVAGDVSCATHREAIALADRLQASIDGPASDTVADGLLAAQRRGRAAATLGELRHRADVVVFWAVDPEVRYPRFLERFVHAPAAFVQNRALIAVDIGGDHGPAECSRRLAIEPMQEVDALSVMRAVVAGRKPRDLAPPLDAFAELAGKLTSGPRYVGIVFDAEPGDSPRDVDFPEALMALAQSLNAVTRAALFALRAGGNRNGFESLLTWQTDFSFAVDFAAGHPVYKAFEPASMRLARGRYAAALVIGNPATIPVAVRAQLERIPIVVVGPRASEAGLKAHIAIDTGSAALHEDGLVLRMDDVPLQAAAVLTHPHSAKDVLRKIAVRLPAPTEVA